MDEMVDVLDAFGNGTGKTVMKSEAHRKGLFHPTVHIWFYTHDGHILLQKRAKGKDTFPSLWDVSVAGHMGAGESVLKSALREVKEEIGLGILETDLKKIGYFKSVHAHAQDLLDCEYHHTFACRLAVPFQELVPQQGEVDALKLIPITAFTEELGNTDLSPNYVPHDRDYYQTIIEAIILFLRSVPG